MKDSAVSEKVSRGSSIHRDASTSVPVSDKNGDRDNQLIGIMYISGCRECRPSLARAIANAPLAQRMAAGNILQKSLGNRFVHGLAMQLKRELIPNRTGMPDNLKSGIESLSGMDLSDVRVHYSSSDPARINALAYTQGQEIYVAPGQELHLPHEAWHVVQQAQGRVKPTMQINGLGINDDPSLEHEADIMGAKTAQLKAQGTDIRIRSELTEHLEHEACLVPQQTDELNTGSEAADQCQKRVPGIGQNKEDALHGNRKGSWLEPVQCNATTKQVSIGTHCIQRTLDLSLFSESTGDDPASYMINPNERM